jgi:hypothetical protein
MSVGRLRSARLEAHGGMPRREALLCLGGLGLGALGLPALLAADRARAAGLAATSPSARSCILLFLWGGPPHQDLWDLKPDAPEGIRSRFRPIDASVQGVKIGDRLPQVALHADKLVIVRSMTHSSNDHEISIYRALTGRFDPSVAVPNHFRRRSHFPNLAGAVAKFSPASAVPASVTVPGPIWYSGVAFAGTYAGFLGQRYDPIELDAVPHPNAARDSIWAQPGAGGSDRLADRRGLVAAIEHEDRIRDGTGAAGYHDMREQAFALIASGAAKAALDLDREDGRTRDRYGRNVYGESFLLARRLVEAGVRLVTVNWMHFLEGGGTINPWDNHGGLSLLGGISGYEMLDQPYCVPSLDRAYSALLEDLAQRGLLDETLVVLTGEFGRTPRINAAQGRDHWGMCYSAVLAGGGVPGGRIVGASDRDAAWPKDTPVAPEDLLARIYQALGIPAHAELRDELGRPYALCEGRRILELL